MAGNVSAAYFAPLRPLQDSFTEVKIVYNVAVAAARFPFRFAICPVSDCETAFFAS